MVLRLKLSLRYGAAKKLEGDYTIGELFEAVFGSNHYYANHLVDPLMSGIWAGDINKLSARSTLHVIVPEVYDSRTKKFKSEEIENGSGLKELEKRMEKSRSFAFDGGFKTLIDALETHLKDKGVLFKPEAALALRYQPGLQRFSIFSSQLEFYHNYDALISAVPAHILGAILHQESNELKLNE